jgi:hypothetical protein
MPEWKDRPRDARRFRLPRAAIEMMTSPGGGEVIKSHRKSSEVIHGGRRRPAG